MLRLQSIEISQHVDASQNPSFDQHNLLMQLQTLQAQNLKLSQQLKEANILISELKIDNLALQNQICRNHSDLAQLPKILRDLESLQQNYKILKSREGQQENKIHSMEVVETLLATISEQVSVRKIMEEARTENTDLQLLVKQLQYEKRNLEIDNQHLKADINKLLVSNERLRTEYHTPLPDPQKQYFNYATQDQFQGQNIVSNINVYKKKNTANFIDSKTFNSSFGEQQMSQSGSLFKQSSDEPKSNSWIKNQFGKMIVLMNENGSSKPQSPIDDKIMDSCIRTVQQIRATKPRS